MNKETLSTKEALMILAFIFYAIGLLASIVFHANDVDRKNLCSINGETEYVATRILAYASIPSRFTICFLTIKLENK